VSKSEPGVGYEATVEAAVERSIARLDLETKVRLLTGQNFWATYAAPQVGLRPIIVSDGPAGVKGGSAAATDKTTSLPSPTAIAASWDEELVARLGELLAGEARRKGVDVVLGPTINLHRSPLGGRHFEQFSEDPLLTGRLATAYVQGLQALGVGGCPKHYVCNESETERQSYTVDVAERPLRELYMAPFERAIREGGAWTVMAAYSGVRGTPMTESDLLTEPLDGDWGFDGVTMSDWFAAQRTVEAGGAALDLVMPGPDGPWGDKLLAAVRGGEVSEAAIDAKIRRLLRLAARVGALEGVPPAKPMAVRAPEAEVAAVVRKAAAAGSVLLTNDGTLPLALGDLRRVAVLGPQALMPPAQGGGSSKLRPDYSVRPIDGLRSALAGVEILTNPADLVQPGWQPLAHSETLLPAEAGADAGKPGILVRIFDGKREDGRILARAASLAGEIGLELTRQIRPDGLLQWGGDPAMAGRTVFELSTRVVSPVSGRHKLGLMVNGHVAMWVGGKLVYDEGVPPTAIDIEAFWGDSPYRETEVEMTAGQPVEFRVRWSKFFDQSAAKLTMGMVKPNATPAEALAESERLARLADAVVVMVGTTDKDESEGRDRKSLALQPDQNELVRRVAAANPRTIVVLSAGSPVEMPWRDDVAAILLTWFPGQEGGNALADMLLGKVEPGGRLPTTWPIAMADVPVLDTQPVDGWLHYTEGIHIGYRAWLRAERAPAFPFGHGHGYTSWTYLDVEPSTFEGSPAVKVRLRNTGARAGREVVQLYLARQDSSIERPLLWLGGFAIVEAGPGQTAEVIVPVDRWALRHWDETAGAWAIEPGRFEVRVGRSIGDLRLAAAIEV
jgi:beta-glucosidase